MKKYSKKKIQEFLRESNAIEGVYDKDSLIQATLAWNFLEKQKTLDHKIILETHAILMLNQPLMSIEKGAYRRVPVYIGGHEAINWARIEIALDDWLLDVKTSIKIPGEDGKHIKLDHITYEGIHPFVDGNGRTGRMFMNWERIQAGLPILIIKADWPKVGGEQYNYYKWFQKDV